MRPARLEHYLPMLGNSSRDSRTPTRDPWPQGDLSLLIYAFIVWPQSLPVIDRPLKP